jgi:outer membrane protein OmpA-like peptidoglycan-associated protein
MKKKIKHRSHYKNWHAFAVPIIEKFGTKYLLDFPKEFGEFWKKYKETYEEEELNFKSSKFRKRAQKRLLDMAHKQKVAKSRSIALHENYIKFHVETKQQQRTKLLDKNKAKRAVLNESDNFEIITKKIEKKKITEISFASSITVETVERIENETQFLNEFVKDYINQVKSLSSLETLSSSDILPHKSHYVNLIDKRYTENQSAVGERQPSLSESQETQGDEQEASGASLSATDCIKKGVANSPKIGQLERNDLGGVGGMASSRAKKRSTFNFQHLTLTNQFRQKLTSIADDLTGKILSCNPRELSDINKTLDTISKLIDTTRKLDLQPVYMLNQIAEGGFNRQKELQGAVVNDKSMIDNGQIVLEKVKEETQITSEDVEKDLKLIGSSLLLNTASQFAEEANTLDQEPIEAEFTTEHERDK